MAFRATAFWILLLISFSSARWYKFKQAEYLVVSKPKTFSQAFLNCQNMKANLVKINSSDIQRFLVNKLSKLPKSSNWNTHFIGLQRVGSKFRWMDGAELKFRWWKVGEPSDLSKNEKCTAMEWPTAYKWNDIRCSRLERYICQRYISVNKTTTPAKRTVKHTSTSRSTTITPTSAAHSTMTKLHITNATVTELPITDDVTPYYKLNATKNFGNHSTHYNEKNENTLPIILSASIGGFLFLCAVAVAAAFCVRKHQRPQKTQSMDSGVTAGEAENDEARYRVCIRPVAVAPNQEEETGYIEPNPVFPARVDEQGYVEFGGAGSHGDHKYANLNDLHQPPGFPTYQNLAEDSSQASPNQYYQITAY